MQMEGKTMRSNRRFKSWLVALAAFSCVGALPNPVFAQEGLVEEVIVTGSRVRGRTAADTAVPVDILTREMLENSGESEIGPILQRIAPSFNYSRTTIGDGSDLMRPATLRGMGPDQVLVLVNGKRRHSQAWVHIQQQVGRGTSGTDLNAIPVMAVERIEVLRDGAAAQYGSDAIAGVINIILKDDVGRTQTSARYGRTSHDDGDQVWVSGNTGFGEANGTFINLTAEYSDTDRTEREKSSSIPLSGGGPRGDIFRIGNSENDNWNVWFNSELETGELSEVYAFGGMSSREGESGGFYRFEFQPDRSVPQVYPDGFLPLQTTKTEDISVVLGWRTDFWDTWTLDIGGGYGENKFTFGAKNSINASIAAEYLQNNPGATDPEIAANAGPTSGDSGDITFEQVTFNIDVTTEFDTFLPDLLYVAAGFEYRDEEYELGSGVPASYTCGLISQDPLGFPSVIDPTVTANCGFQGFPGYSPATAQRGQNDRDNIGVYVDAETNLTDSLQIGAAVRYEDYDDAGDQWIGKLSGRFQVVDNFALRGAASTGFRAPSLAQRAFTTVITDAGASGLRQTYHAPEGDPIAAAYGVTQLEHEESTSYSGGFIWDITDSLEVTVDAYYIEVDDRVVLGGVLDGSTNPAAAALLAANGYDGAQFFSNAIDTETTGVDVVAIYDWPLGDYGDLRIIGSYNHSETDVDSINPPAGVAASTIFPKAQVDLTETGQPQDRLMLEFDWIRGSWSADLRFNYFGEVETSFWTCDGLGIPDGGAPGNICRDVLGLDDSDTIKSDGAVLTDLEVRYAFDNGLTLTAGGTNIFDEQPDELRDNAVHRWISDDTSGFGNFDFPWESTPYGTDGSFFYVKAGFTFAH
jgi:iron complex outermembrane receptor protein